MFSLLTASHASVIVDLQTDLNAVVDALAPKHYATLRAAVRAHGTLGTGRRLAVADQIRLRKAVFPDRVLWLMRVIATDGSVEQIDKKLSTEVGPLLRPGFGDMRDLVRVVSPKRVNLNEFRGARAALSGGDWASSLKLGALSKAATEEILGSPDQWPSDIVQRAAGRVEDRMTKRLPPLAAVAEENSWFA